MTKFDQTEEIRERLRSKVKKTVREKRVLKTGTAESKTRGRYKSAKMIVANENKEIFGIKMSKFVRELNKRPNISKLYLMADEMMAGVIFANASIIQEITELINSGRVAIRDPDESKALLQQLKGATAEVVNGLKALGVAASNRDPEIRGDKAMLRLSALDLKEVLPPTLQGAFLSAQQDLERTEGKDSGSEAAQREGDSRSSVLSKLKRPIQGYSASHDEDSESSSLPEEKIHDPKVDGLVIP